MSKEIKHAVIFQVTEQLKYLKSIQTDVRSATEIQKVIDWLKIREFTILNRARIKKDSNGTIKGGAV